MSDPNDIIKNFNLQEEEEEEQKESKGFIPPWMERVADQGGWKEAEEALTVMSKIKPKSWKAIGETTQIFMDFLDSGVFGGLKDIGEDFKTTLSLQVEEALAPLTNQIDQALSDAFAPIMPEIQAFTTEIADWFAIAIGTWEAVIKGKWDDVLQDITDKMPDWFKKLKNDFRDRLDKMLDDLKSGSIETLSSLPGLPTGVGTGFDIAQSIVAAWTGFWRDLGWK